MRRILIPLIFAALLTVAAVVPAAASGPGEAPKQYGDGCGVRFGPVVHWICRLMRPPIGNGRPFLSPRLTLDWWIKKLFQDPHGVSNRHSRESGNLVH